MEATKIATALLACLVLGAVTANAAQAAAGEGWTIGTTENQTTAGTLIPSGTHERVTCKRHGTSSLVFTSTLLGAPVELSATGVDCLEKAGSTNAATIDNTTRKGHIEAVLTFTGVQVIKPTHCAVPGGELTTAPILGEVTMDPTLFSGVVFDRFFGDGATFITISFEGKECVLDADSAPVNGTVCGEAVHTNVEGTGYEPNATGTLTKVQTLLFGEPQQTTGNIETEKIKIINCALTFGKVAAQLTGAIDTELASGRPFGAD